MVFFNPLTIVGKIGKDEHALGPHVQLEAAVKEGGAMISKEVSTFHDEKCMFWVAE